MTYHNIHTLITEYLHNSNTLSLYCSFNSQVLIKRLSISRICPKIWKVQYAIHCIVIATNGLSYEWRDWSEWSICDCFQSNANSLCSKNASRWRRQISCVDKDTLQELNNCSYCCKLYHIAQLRMVCKSSCSVLEAYLCQHSLLVSANAMRSLNILSLRWTENNRILTIPTNPSIRMTNRSLLWQYNVQLHFSNFRANSRNRRVIY